MGFYNDRIVPHLVDKTCGMAALAPIRAQACEPLRGSVVEIGFGSGRNVDAYPRTVTEITAVEPSDVAWSMAAHRVREARVPIRRAGLDGQHLPFDDASFDCALSTFTMCTIPDLGAALAEIRRVLRPDGTLVFLEHGLAPAEDTNVRRWQRRLEPIQKRVAGGCHLTRDIGGAIEDAGFDLPALTGFYLTEFPKSYSRLTFGAATGPLMP